MSEKHIFCTTIFSIKDRATDAHFMTRDELDDDRRSLDLTEWQPVLAMWGWKLIYPPRVEVFYNNECLAIGAEIPADIVPLLGSGAYETITNDYMRGIASLLFPHSPISALPVNETHKQTIEMRQDHIPLISDQMINALTLSENVEKILALYNLHHSTCLRMLEFDDLPPIVVAMQLLKTNNIDLLRNVLPLLLNIDLSEQQINEEVLHSMRDMYLLDVEARIAHVENIEQIQEQIDFILLRK